MRTFYIEDKKIGNKQPVLIIAEAGVNHNGDLNLALRLVDAAADAGADVIKFQTFKAEQVVTMEGEMAQYQKINLGLTMKQRTLLRKLELQEKFYIPIIHRCKQREIIFLSTPHGGKESVDFLESMEVCAYKIGSGDLDNFILLNKVAKTKKPIILSTGMANLKDIDVTVSYLRTMGNNEIALLHCTTNYPCPLNEVNLLAMCTMMNRWNIPIGYSDHTIGNQTAIMAVTLGAAIYECHLTLDKNLPGPDHRASSDPCELKEKILAIRNVEVILGHKIKKPAKSEISSMKKTIRRSIVAAHDITAGKIITEDDLEAKRPGNGLSPRWYEFFLGKRMKFDKKKDKQLAFRDVS